MKIVDSLKKFYQNPLKLKQTKNQQNKFNKAYNKKRRYKLYKIHSNKSLLNHYKKKLKKISISKRLFR